jgi:hypothetical protein
MQALRDRISSKLSDKSKSKDKDKDGTSSLKTSASADGKQTTLSDSHHQGSLSSSAIASSATSANAQSSEKGIRFFLNFFQSQ